MIASCDIEQIKTAAMSRFEELCAFLIPGGRKKHGRWTAATISGGKGGSFNVNLKTGHFGDWAEDHRMRSGPIDLWMATRQVDFLGAITGLADWLGMPLHNQKGATAKEPSVPKPGPELQKQYDRPQPLFPRLEPPTEADLKALGLARGCYIEGLAKAARRGFLWGFDDKTNGRCWLYTDSRRRCGLRRRLDGKPYVLKEGGETKSASCYGSVMSEPLGYEEARHYPDFALVEGATDGLAVLSLAWSYAMEKRIAPVVMPCAASNFSPESLEALKGKNARVFIDNDQAGYTAGLRWLEQLEIAGIDADAFTFERLTKANGEPVKDLCDMHRVDGECWRHNLNSIVTMWDFGWEKEQKQKGKT